MKAQSFYSSYRKRICTVLDKGSMGTRIFNPYYCYMAELIMCLPFMTGDCQEQTRQFHGSPSWASLFLQIFPVDDSISYWLLLGLTTVDMDSKLYAFSSACKTPLKKRCNLTPFGDPFYRLNWNSSFRVSLFVISCASNHAQWLP